MSELNIDLKKSIIDKHLANFRARSQDLSQKVLKIFSDLYSTRDFDSDSVDSQLYDKLFDRSDSAKLAKIRDTQPSQLLPKDHIFSDDRLNKLIFLYKARNYPKSLNPEEVTEYEHYRQKLLLDGGASSRLNKFSLELSNLEKDSSLTQDQTYLLEELKLYVESILPADI